MKPICILTIFLISLISVNGYGYPVMTFEKNVNITEAKKVVYSIPEEYFEYVNRIDFAKEPVKKWVRIKKHKLELVTFSGWNKVKWGKHHNCYYVEIDIFLKSPVMTPYETLVHELGHVYEYCVLKRDKSTEEFADNFKIK